MRFLTWDVGIVAALGLLVCYSLLIRKHKSLATLVSVYIAYLVAATWGQQLSDYLSGDRAPWNWAWLKANATPFAVQTAILLLVTVLLSAFIKLAGRRSRYGAAEVVAYAVATTALAAMFVLSFMGADQRAGVLAASKIMPYVFEWRQWILGLPVLAMVFFGVYGDED